MAPAKPKRSSHNCQYPKPLTKTITTITLPPHQAAASFSPSPQQTPKLTSVSTLPTSNTHKTHNTDIAKVHGIIPRPPTHKHPQQQQAKPTQARKSTYPRPSPPAFWRLEHIAPPRPTNPQTMPPAATNTLWTLPYGLEVLIFTSMAMGLLWWVVVVLLNFPPLSVLCCRERGREREREKKKKMMMMRGGRYSDDNHSVQQARGKEKGKQGSVLRDMRGGGGGLDSDTGGLILQTCSSQEWLARREAFFSPESGDVGRVCDGCVLVEGYLDACQGACALEEAVGPVSPCQMPAPLTPFSTPRERSWGCVDKGLSAIDEGLDYIIEKFVRWVDDDEGELLPMNRS